MFRSASVLFSLLVGLAAARNPEGFQVLKPGDPAPDFALRGVDGKTWKLADFAKGKLLVVMFTCNHCPTAQAIEKRFIKFVDDYRPRGVEIVAISPNSPLGIRPEELGYSHYGDTLEDMVKHAKKEGFNFPYLYDGDTQVAAKAYGCLATPHVFVFDAERRLQYQGRFDDSRYADPATIESHDTISVVDALLAGKPVPMAQTRPHGCSTKWAFKAEQARAHAEKLDATRVDLVDVDAAGLKALLNDGSGRVRLVNLWATWCIPCVAEFPDLVGIGRKFGMRDFEFVSISLDDPRRRQRARDFLEKCGAAPSPKLARALKTEKRTTPHFLYTGKQDDLAAALDPEWPGPIPHTVLFDTEGKILARWSGRIDREEVTAAILAHLGRFYVPK